MKSIAQLIPAALLAGLALASAGSVQAEQYTVTCESKNYQRAECGVGGGPVFLTRQLSSPPGDCIQGRTWGFDSRRNTIWVNNGCRAEFRATVARPPSPWQPGGEIVTCESQNYRYTECDVFGGPVGLVWQLSTPPGDCIQGKSWGFNASRNKIWVSNGCRGEFRVGGGRPPPPSPSTSIVTCESRNYGDAECYTGGGPVFLVRQLSTPPGDCIEGQTWGWDRNSIWVRGGCRAEFRVGSSRPPPPPPQSIEIVTCESRNYREAECPVPGGPVAILRQLSAPPGNCIEGQTWGYNGFNNSIWVRNGCRAEFRVGYDADRWP
jgi:hypothetical protein